MPSAHPTIAAAPGASPRVVRDKKSSLAAGHHAVHALLSPTAAGSVSADYEYDASGAPQEVHRVPADQLSGLSEEQKSEVFTKVLSALNPQAARALTRFDYAEGGYRAAAAQSQLAVHFSMDGLLIHNDSEEAREQRDWLALNKDRVVELRSAGTDTNSDEREGGSASPPMSPSARPRGDEDEDGASSAAAVSVNDKALKNQFNYSERGNQTVNGVMREREVATEPPPCLDFSGQVTHWEIFDTYCDAMDRELSQREAKEKPRKKAGGDDDDEQDGHARPTPLSTLIAAGSGASSFSLQQERVFSSPSCLLALKTMERLINQNAESAAFRDYKFRTDDADAAAAPLPPPQPPAGKKAAAAHLPPPSSLAAAGPFIPLWKFSHPEAKNLTVTGIAFNPAFPDLFAVSYGSFDFGAAKGRRGLVCVFTLKNVGWPEYLIRPAGAVQSLDFHLSHPALLVCGLYDGNVAVYDIRAKSSEPLFSSDDPKLKHSDCVWQVRWSRDGGQQAAMLKFVSVAADGRVNSWQMNKNELQVEEIVTLAPAPAATAAATPPVPAPPVPPVAASSSSSSSTSSASSSAAPSDDLVVTAGGSCFDFNLHFPHLFLLGGEDGSVSLYDLQYNAQLVRSFLGHQLCIYSLSFSPFHPGVFLSASADWQVRLWEMDSEAPVMTFDLNCQVGDVCWSPHCSSAFAVVTSDGRLRLFDLSVSKQDAVGEIRLNKKSRLTKVRWSASEESILCVGDDRGVVSVVKVVLPGRRGGGAGKAVDVLEEVRRLERLLVLKEREDGRQPDYLRDWIAAEEKKREGNEKLRLATKMAVDKVNAAAAGANGSTSPLGSPKAKPAASPRQE